MNDFAAGAVLSPAGEEAAGVCRLDLVIDDSTIVPELLAYAAGPERDKYALTALRIGVLALKQAQGRLDADVIRGEGDRLLTTLEERLTNHQRSVQDQVATTLREYFDPTSGRFSERVEQLVKSGGELERMLRSQIGESDSELAKTSFDRLRTNGALLALTVVHASRRCRSSARTVTRGPPGLPRRPC